MMDEHLSTNTNQPDKPPPLKEKQVWIIGMGVLGVILGLLLLSEITLLFFKNKGWTTHTSGRWVSALAVDKEDRIWAAYYRSTMLYPDDGEPVQIPLNAEMADDSVRSLAVDGQNRIWAGTASGFVCMRDIDGQWTIYTPENPENDNTIWDIVIDGQDRAWVRSISGLGMIDPSASGTIYTFRNSGLTDSEVRAIAVDNKGRLWASSKRMLKILYSDGNWALRAAAPSFGSGLAIDEQGQVWVQTLDGIGVLGLNGDWKSYRLGTYIGPIVADKKGRIWVSRFGELLMFDPDTGWTTYHTLNSGLNDSGVNALVADRQNRVWMGTNDGLRVFDEEEALSPTSVQKIVVLTNSIIPSAAVGNTLIIVLVIVFTRPGAINVKTIGDFCLGLVGWFAIHSLYWGAMWLIYSPTDESIKAYFQIFLCFPAPLPVNVIALILLYQARRWVVLGALSAFAVNSIGILLTTPVTDPNSYHPMFVISKIGVRHPFFF